MKVNVGPKNYYTEEDKDNRNISLINLREEDQDHFQSNISRNPINEFTFNDNSYEFWKDSSNPNYVN